MRSRQEEINKLLLNPSFRNWALNTNIEDFEEWENNLTGDDAIRQLAQEAKQIIIQIELLDNKLEQSDNESFDRFREKLRKTSDEKLIQIADQSKPQLKPQRLGLSGIIKIAAVISFMIVFSGILYFNADETEEPVTHVATMVRKQTQNGQQLTITLPDGSKVKLNSNSGISYPKEFFTNRHVELEGEAFFFVVRNESNPFIVTTNQFRTEVLGTSFNINAYENFHGKVSVAEGKVKVDLLHKVNGKGAKILEKEEAVEIVDKEIRESEFSVDEILWKDGILVFHNENIQTISSKIRRWFNVTVTVKNEAAIAGEFSGKYSNESLEEILTGMGYSLNFSFEMKGNEIIISGKD